MRRTMALLLMTLGLGTGCGGSDEFATATPEASALQMELTGSASAEGLSTSDADWGAAQQALSGPVPEWLQHTRDAVRALNEGVADVLAPVAEIIAANAKATQTGTVKTFAPHDKDGATFLFSMKKLADKTFGWALQAKPAGQPDTAYVTVMGGVLEAGAEAHHGRGVMGADLDKLAMVDAAFHGNGQLLVGFAHVGGYKVLAYGLHNFSPDVNQYEPVDAVFSGWRGPDGGTRVRLATYANIADSATTAKELLLLRARWLPGVGGRADALVVQGDVPAGHVLVANSCWDRDLSDVDGFYAIRDCMATSMTTSCTVIKSAGKPSNCARGLEDEDLPPSSATDPTMEPGAPEQPALPLAMPSGN